MTCQTLSDSQCLTVDQNYYSSQKESWSQAAVITWFHNSFQQNLSQLQVSRILGSNYAYLDDLGVRSALEKK
jgi:hypothetical protein